MSESEFLKAVIGICDELGLSYHHCRDGRHCDGKGFPDLVILGRNGVLFAELKTDTGRQKPEQILWGKRLVYANVPYALWRPQELHSGHIRASLVSLAGSKALVA